MNKRPFFAAMLFGGLSLAGIVAMFSQTEPANGTMNGDMTGSRRVSLNPEGSREPRYGEVLPSVIEDGIEHELEKLTSDDEECTDPEPRRKILRLR